MLYVRSDQVMLDWLRGHSDVGQYSVAARVAEALYFLPVILSNTFLPKIGRGSGLFESDSALRQLYRSAWILGVGMALTSTFLLPSIVPLVFGDEFLPAQAALAWLGPASFAVSTGCASGAWLNIQGHQKLIAQRSAIGAMLNVVLNLALIPGLGVTGAAIATLISYTCAPYLGMIVHSRETRKNALFLLAPL
jgi:O-antigen/teichoic acid export membrane protein